MSQATQEPQGEEVFVFPTSFAQERLWFLDKLSPGSSAYHLSRALRLTGPLNVNALEQSLCEIVRRHETLRTTFATHEGETVQVISPTAAATLPLVDLSAFDPAERDARLQDLIRKEALWKFDLEHGPLLRTILVKLATNEHVLLLSMHHIISDGWSMSVFHRELSRFYQSFAEGTWQPAADLPIQYADYAAWQKEWLQDQVLEEQLAYWKQQLRSIPPLLELPTDHPRPPEQSYAGQTLEHLIPRALSDTLDRLSHAESVTLFMTLLAAFQVLLYRYSGQEDILVGSPIANRKRAEIEGLIGFFVNTLVLRGDLSGNPSFQELLRRVREVALNAFAHQDLPFEKLVEEINPERSLSRSPLFQVMFVLQNTPARALEFPGLQVEFLPRNTDSAMFDLSLELTVVPEGLKASWEYSTDLFDGTTIQRMMRSFQVLLESIVANPRVKISELAMLAEPERRQMLVEWNDTRREYPRDKCIHQLFEEQVARTPGAVAVTLEGAQLTYRELNNRANRLARYLRNRGVGPDRLVGVCMQRSPEMIVAILGILKAGGAYMPLDPAYPRERLAFLVKDAQLELVLTQRRLFSILPPNQTSILCLDTERAIGREDGTNLETITHSGNLAYVIYTSGSTGTPKGVLIEHRSLVNYVVAIRQIYQMCPDDRMLQFSSINFDASAEEIFTPLLTGAALVLRTESMLDSVGTFLRKCREEAITVLDLPTAYWQVLVTALDKDSMTLPPSIRLVTIGGDSVKSGQVAAWHRRVDERVQLFNVYGPTETTIGSTIKALDKTESGPGSFVSIGRPIANTTVYLLDAHCQPVPVGIRGELYIGGSGLARGYLNRAELTGEKFIRDSFSTDPNARLYKTGDVCRYRPDGNLEYIERADDQVKIRGYRIELGEIEATLNRHPGVSQAVVVAYEFPDRNKQPVAYFISSSAVPPDANALRAFLKERLPEYMLPRAFIAMVSFPLTPNGKLDRKALPLPDNNQASARRFVEPRDDVERRLAQIWQQVLNVCPIGVRDDFFELGGHSLLGVRLFTLIEKAFGKTLSLATLFQAPTIEQMANLLRQDTGPVTGSSLVPIQPSGCRPPFYCVHEYDGNVIYYRHLSRYLGPDQPFYGLQAQGLDGRETPLARFEDIATHYVGEIRRSQPEGPYFLGGSSLGGLLAFEMAQQLVAQGQKVGLLALFDTWSPGYTKLLALPINDVVSRHTEALAKLGVRGKLAYVRNRAVARLSPNRWIKKYTRNITRSIKQKACDLCLDLKHPIPGPLLNFYIGQIMVQADQNYVPRPYPGKVTFFLADQPPEYYHDPHMSRQALIAAGFTSTKNVETVWEQVYPLGWEALAAGGLEIIPVPGSHAQIVREPHVAFLAEKLRASIEKACNEMS